MDKLPVDKFELARRFILRHGRPLEARLFEYFFEGASKAPAVRALAAFQNPDGGFGNGIEPDFRLPASSPMATSVGLQACFLLGLDCGNDMVQAAVRYLADTYDMEGRYWPVAPPAINDHPHAPWWHAADTVSPPEEERWSNPGAELLGYLYACPDVVPPSVLENATQRGLQNLRSGVAFGSEPFFYQMLTWERAANYLPGEIAGEVREMIVDFYEGFRPLTQEKLTHLHITSLAGSHEAMVYKVLPEDTLRLLQVELTTSGEDGIWQPGWAWGQYEHFWPAARMEWAALITFYNLLTFKRFGMLEKGG